MPLPFVQITFGWGERKGLAGEEGLGPGGQFPPRKYVKET